MYKTKDKEGRKREKKRRSWGSRRSSYRQGIRQQQSKQATVQMELPGKVRADGMLKAGPGSHRSQYSLAASQSGF